MGLSDVASFSYGFLQFFSMAKVGRSQLVLQAMDEDLTRPGAAPLRRAALEETRTDV